MTTLWNVSTNDGANLSADELVGVLAAHHDRVIEGWLALSPEQWEQPSRNTSWSAHTTARHVADCMDAVAAEILGEPNRFSVTGFDPNATPDAWLALSADDSPARTIERFATAAPQLRGRVGERIAASDNSTGTTVYGPAHWTVNIVHVFWDSWLHERDVLLPLDLSVESTHDEQRLAAIYGLLMSMVPARMMEQSFAAAISFTGAAEATVSAAHDSGHVSSAETLDTKVDLEGDLCAVVDSLSGRGAPLKDLLPAAPDLLAIFADILAG